MSTVRSEVNVKPEVLTFNELKVDIERGEIKIPKFQRGFVWEIDKTARLLDSILRRYPIGSFVFWETNERLRSVRNIGNIKLPDAPSDRKISYILDGQQRLTSIYASLIGAKLDQDHDFTTIYYNFAAKDDEPIIVASTEGLDSSLLIPFYELISNRITELIKKYPSCPTDQIEDVTVQLHSYSFPVIKLKDASLDVATEIFTRINTGGVPLDPFDILVAKTFIEGQFDLEEKTAEIQSNLEKAGYTTISNYTVVQAFAACVIKDIRTKSILNIPREVFLEYWEKFKRSFEFSIDYFRDYFRIKVSRLLPYPGLLIPFTYFFYLHPDRPSHLQGRQLQDYFWRVILTKRFSSSLETKINSDLKEVILPIINDTSNISYKEPVDITKEFLNNNSWFNAGNAFIKGILCIYAAQNPLSFENNSDVNLRNDWLAKRNSVNYHHFFPQAFLKKQGFSDWPINHVANITLVDDYLNKRVIRAQAPSDYVSEFAKHNEKLMEALRTHLIGDITEFGIETNNYELFINKRLQMIEDELKKRLLLRLNFDRLDNPDSNYEIHFEG